MGKEVFKEFLRLMKPSVRKEILIDSQEKLEEAAIYYGLLPFFRNNVKGLSVEEMCAPGMLFGGNFDEGCWEWKGPVIRKRTTAYGKFFKRKAGFVALDLLPDFLNYRRYAYPVKKGGIDEMLLEIIRENDSLTSTELRQLIFGGRKRNWDDLPEIEGNLIINSKNKGLEGPLQRLQMGGWLVISDFEYKKAKNGERYGWGVARYSTPEVVFHDLKEKLERDSTGIKLKENSILSAHSPERSLELLISNKKRINPRVSFENYRFLIK